MFYLNPQLVLPFYVFELCCVLARKILLLQMLMLRCCFGFRCYCFCCCCAAGPARKLLQPGRGRKQANNAAADEALVSPSPSPSPVPEDVMPTLAANVPTNLPALNAALNTPKAEVSGEQLLRGVIWWGGVVLEAVMPTLAASMHGMHGVGHPACADSIERSPGHTKGRGELVCQDPHRGWLADMPGGGVAASISRHLNVLQSYRSHTGCADIMSCASSTLQAYYDCDSHNARR